MQHLCGLSLRSRHPFRLLPPACQGQVRFFALIELSHILHRLCRPPSISLSFNLATVLPRRCTYRVSFATNGVDSAHSKCTPFTARTTRVSNPVCSLAFVPQCQVSSRDSPSPLVFLSISTHFTATPRIPVSPPTLERESFQCSSRVEPGDFTSNLPRHLRTLYAQ